MVELQQLQDDPAQEQLWAFGTGMTMSLGVFEVQAHWGKGAAMATPFWRRSVPPAVRNWRKSNKAPSGNWKTRSW